jgi:hypothetical protein
MDTLPFFVQTLITLVDRIKGIKEAHVENRQQAFEKIIEPLFVEIQPVVDNYFVLFREAKDLIRASSEIEMDVAIKKIRDSRESMLRTRIEVREMAKQMQSIYNDKKIIDFARKIDSFFYKTICDRKIRGKSYALELVDLFEYVNKKEVEKAELIAFIDLALKNMEIAWVAIAQSYATLRIYCLSNPKDVNIKLS